MGMLVGRGRCSPATKGAKGGGRAPLPPACRKGAVSDRQRICNHGEVHSSALFTLLNETRPANLSRKTKKIVPHRCARRALLYSLLGGRTESRSRIEHAGT